MNLNLTTRTKASLAGILAAVLLSTGGIFVKLVDLNPISIAGLRSLFSAITLIVYLKLRGQKINFTWSKAQVIGAISYSGMVTTYVIANKLTSSANVILLQYTAPIFVAILSFFILKEKITKVDLISVGLVFLGMVIFFLDNTSPSNTLGNLVSIMSGIFLAGSTVCLRLQKDGSAIESTILGNILTFLISIPFLNEGLGDLKGILVIIIMGIFQLGIAYIFYVYSTKHLPALDVILISIVEPLLNPLWVFVFAGEVPSIYSFIGGSIVILSVVLRSLYLNREKNQRLT